MSHLTANPFQKHYEFPRPGPLLTPPDTEREPEYAPQPPSALPSALTSALPSGGYQSSGLGIEFEPSPTHRMSPVPDGLGSIRKVSSLPYINSGPREARERVVQRGMRWLVVVVPPRSFADEHGNLGHTLAVGSSDRLSQGILMPLYSTMSKQLVAIAREFAFPSTSGLCLYLHTTYSGTPVTPRISDESWQLLWSHLFEPRSPTLPHAQLPIGGKIEFDIDLGKARWYESWIGMARRDLMDVPVSVTPSRPESLAHWRADSRTTTVLDDRTEQPDEPLDMLHLGRAPRNPVQRHVPRKLSLLDRYEATSVRSGSKLVPRDMSPPSPSPAAAVPEARHPLALSPIVQGGSEPASARKDIDRFVNSWRQSATVAASPMAATGQTSLDPVNLPNDMSLADPSLDDDVDATSELNLEDFQWSVSSLGPPDYDDDDLYSLDSWRLPSVHLDRRLEGSVLLSPTTCTSFGPPDWDDDYMSYSIASRLPSPDIAARMIDDCPPTPSTATSWGPPLSYPPSPARSALSYAPSVDVGQRCMSAVPLTPSTATSWGPPLSYPPSPATPYHVHTPDVAQRTFELEAPPLRRYPRLPPPEGLIEIGVAVQVAVHYDEEPVDPDREDVAGQEESADEESHYDDEEEEGVEVEVEPWRSVWPYNSTAEPSSAGAPAASPYSFVFPRRPTSPAVEEGDVAETVQSGGVASLVWPYYNTYAEEAAPAVQAAATREVAEEAPAASTSQFSMVWPYYTTQTEEPSTSVASEVQHFDDDVPPPPERKERKISPFTFVIPTYESPVTAILATAPAAAAAEEASTSTLPVSSSTAAPAPSWQHVWPMFGSRFAAISEEPVQSYTPRYPYFNLYPPVYPSFDLYPEAPGALDQSASTLLSPIQVSLPAAYPTIALYSPVYPENVYHIYPSVRAETRTATQRELPTRLSYGYPNIELYPAVYPYNLDTIYPPKPQSKLEAILVKLPAHYPVLDFYPAVYPFNLSTIYPPKSATLSPSKAVNVKMPAQYPAVEFCRAAYPYNVEQIYEKGEKAATRIELSTRLSYGYPHIELYPAVYPFNLDMIYPEKPQSKLEAILVKLPAHYPVLDFYPAVYPFNLATIYPAKSASLSSVEVKLPAQYPAVEFCRAWYPYNVEHIYEKGEQAATRLELPTRLSYGYPSIELYPAVYPFNLDTIYPEKPQSKIEKILVKLSSHYPVLDFYPAVYPFNVSTLYPAHGSTSAPQSAPDAVEVKLPAQYPALEFYRAVYPYSIEEIYPSSTVRMKEKTAGIVTELQAVYPNIQLYKAVYPYNLESIYPAVVPVTSTARPTRRSPSPSKARAVSPRSSVRGQHVKRGSSSRSASLPPVPPLPPNAQLLAPINPASHLSLAGERMGLSLPVRLPAAYPKVAPYPPAYPYFDLYPEVRRGDESEDQVIVKLKPSYPALDIYDAVYPHFDIYPQAAAEKYEAIPVHSAVSSSSSKPSVQPRRRPTLSHAALHESVFGTVFTPRRKPKHTHADLREMVMKSLPRAHEKPSPIQVTSSPVDRELRRPPSVASLSGGDISPQPISPRRLPVPPVTSSSPLEGAAPSLSPSGSLRSRGRSGTLSGRPPLPTPPGLPSSPSTPPHTPPTVDSPSRPIRKLPAPPSELPSKELPPPPPRTMRPVGLPTDPAVGRRASALGLAARPPPFAPLPPVPEPDAVDAPVYSAPPTRPLPQLNTAASDAFRSGSKSAGLPPTQPLDASPELARAASMSGRPLPRARRGSVMGSSGIVAGLARNYNHGAEEGPRPMSNTLSQFPQPPRPPLPPVPNSRPVSKLDRSKFSPFA